MSSLSKSCIYCSVCWKGGVASHQRILSINHPAHVPNAPILVIDDMPHDPTVDDWDQHAMSYQDHYWRRISFTRTALERICQDVPFTYTQAIRCEPMVIVDSDINPAVACSVWTHNLTAGRTVIITGRYGFNQMKLDDSRFELLKMYRSARLGIIFTVPPIDALDSGDDSVTRATVAETATRFSKILKETKLI